MYDRYINMLFSFSGKGINVNCKNQSKWQDYSNLDILFPSLKLYKWCEFIQ